jgi:hypothetical protein
MARTRTSDFGRVETLHYSQRHGKPQVYAYLPHLLGIAVWALFPGNAVHAQSAERAVPCIECQALSIRPEQVGAIVGDLKHTRVLLRLESGTAAELWRRAYDALRSRGARLGIHLTGIPDPADAALGAAGEALVIEVPDGDRERQAFDLKRALTAARGLAASRALMIAGGAETIAALKARGLDAYVDGYLPPPDTISRPDDLLIEMPPSDLFRIRVVGGDALSAATIASAAAALQSWLPAGLVAVPERALKCAGRALPTYLNPQTLDLLAVGTCRAPDRVTGDIAGVAAERLDVGETSVFKLAAGASSGVASQVDVAAERALTASEIVARHQAAAARQAAEIRTDIATGSLTLTFEAPGFPAPVTVTSRTTIYTGDGRTDLRQQDVRVNGVLFSGNGGVPRLPIIEPERVASPPLAITLTDVYGYDLAGRDTVDGRRCYVIAFRPRAGGASLYAGRAWIDTQTFGLVRVSAAQTGLKGPITASEQTDDYQRDTAGRWLLARSDVRQTYEGASFRTPIHRLLILERHEINASDFVARREVAYASPDIMLRDTPEGYRYLKGMGNGGRRKGNPERGTGNVERGTGKKTTVNPERVVAGKAERLRTLAFGVIVDPNISVPLPFAGLSYVDFNLFGTGAQFSGFFGGSYGQLAFSAPALGGTRWQLAGRAFGIATSYNDRAFVEGKEIYDQDIHQRPAQASVWLLRPVSPRVAVRLQYDWDYTKFGAGDQMAPNFRVPVNQVVHGLRTGLDVQRAGWQGTIWWNVAHRAGWRPWGIPGETDYRPSQQNFQRYGASLLRAIALTPRVTTRIEGAVMAGRDLDRFSRYSFGTFDNRLHGYPSALIRYDRGAVLRTAIAWSAAKAVRLDGFLDTASVHDPGFGRGLRQYTGSGVALEAPAPFGTLLAIEWGYGFQGINTNGRVGTSVVRVSGYKVF